VWLIRAELSPYFVCCQRPNNKSDSRPRNLLNHEPGFWLSTLGTETLSLTSSAPALPYDAMSSQFEAFFGLEGVGEWKVKGR